MTEHTNMIILLIKTIPEHDRHMFSIPTINMSVDHCGPYLIVITVILGF